MPGPRRSIFGTIAGLLLLVSGTLPALAHPHVWLTVETTVLYENGTFTGLQHKWTFDEFYSAMEVEGLDKNGDGKLDRAELSELANFYVTGLKEFSYFTFPALAGHKVKIGEPRDIWLEHTDGRLSLHFTVPFAQPVLTEAKGFAFSVYDPSFYIALDIDKPDSVKIAAGAPKTCALAVGTPKDSANTAVLNEAFSQQFGAMTGATVKAVSVECKVQ